MNGKVIDKPSGTQIEVTIIEHIGKETWDLSLPEVSPATSDSESFSKESPIEEDSPYEEVRAAVPNHDQDLPINTIRAWVIGLTLSAFGACVNTIFGLRQPAISVGSIVGQLLAYLIGNTWARFMPSREFTTFGTKWSLNPGPFNVKEHSIIVVMASVSFGTAYATDILLAQQAFYKQDFGLVFQLLLVITTQSLGYGIAGLLRKALVYPASMIWPANLVSTTLLHAMHNQKEEVNPRIFGGSMSKYRWFGIVFILSFLYYFIPGFLAQFLSTFAFMTWIYPQNVLVNQLFGGNSGLSLIPITFDWTQITGYVGNPMITPWFAIANTLVGTIFFFIIGTSVLHYSGTWHAKYLPISDSSIYDNKGHVYNVTRIMTSSFTLDVNAYKSYSPLFISTTFAISYGLSFAAITSMVVYIWLHHRSEIIGQFRNARNENQDIHMKLMSNYKEAPHWWYGIIFLVMFSLSLVTVLKFPTEFTWWAFLLAVMFSTIMALPVGIIQAITNQQLGLNVITEFIMGYMQPGKPLALMLFKTYGYITASQALSFVSDLKFGHYMKIPPRTMFTAQILSLTLSCLVQVFTLRYALANIKEICTLGQEQHFTCPGARVFFSASVIWGLLGPKRIFSPGQVYQALLLGFPIGIVLPIIVYYLTKRYPTSFLKYTMIPLILGGSLSIPPATPLNYLSWGWVGYIFQSYIRKRYSEWWKRLNYITASGLDTGLAISTLFIFFVFTMNNIKAPSWWGNNVVLSTIDSAGKVVRAHVPEDTIFGPAKW